MRKFLVCIAAVGVLASSPADAKKKPQISGLELQQIQARDFEIPKSIAFPAVMTVLQDAGYRIAGADKDTGLITGSGSTNSKLSWNIFFGIGRSKKTPVVSAFIEERGTGSRIRLNFVMAKTKSSVYGMSTSDEEPITDPATYRDAFEKINKEIFIRQALNAPKPPVNAAAIVTPAAAANGMPTASTATIVAKPEQVAGPGSGPSDKGENPTPQADEK